MGKIECPIHSRAGGGTIDVLHVLAKTMHYIYTKTMHYIYTYKNSYSHSGAAYQDAEVEHIVAGKGGRKPTK
jgi:hypothetical protein